MAAVRSLDRSDPTRSRRATGPQAATRGRLGHQSDLLKPAQVAVQVLGRYPPERLQERFELLVPVVHRLDGIAPAHPPARRHIQRLVLDPQPPRTAHGYARPPSHSSTASLASSGPSAACKLAWLTLAHWARRRALRASCLWPLRLCTTTAHRSSGPSPPANFGNSRSSSVPLRDPT